MMVMLKRELVQFAFVVLILHTVRITAIELVMKTVPDNTTHVNVTAVSGKNDYTLGVVGVPMTWADATETCRNIGYGGLLYSQPAWQHRSQVRHYLERVNFNGLNYSFWMGAIRPFSHVRKWYRFTSGNCAEPTDPYLALDGEFTDGQCSALRRNASVPQFFETGLIEDCTRIHSFVCVREYGPVKFNVYAKFYVESEPLDGVFLEEHNVTADECLSTCLRQSKCLAFTYYTGQNSCLYLNRASKLVITLNYTILPYTSATHYAKGDCILKFWPPSDLPPVGAVSQTVPTCGIDELPPNYLPCNCDNQPVPCGHEDMSENELEQTVTELVDTLTVAKGTTTINKRKKMSAIDERKSSKIFGIVGSVCLACFIAFFPLCDLLPKKSKTSIKQQNRSKNKK